jgi:hypothetical protein
MATHAAGIQRGHAAIDAELAHAHAIPLTWYDVLLELNAAPDRRPTSIHLGRTSTRPQHVTRHRRRHRRRRRGNRQSTHHHRGSSRTGGRCATTR